MGITGSRVGSLRGNLRGEGLLVKPPRWGSCCRHVGVVSVNEDEEEPDWILRVIDTGMVWLN